MDAKQIMKIFEDTAYVHIGGTEQEKKAAAYIADCCKSMGLNPTFEEFEVPMADVHTAKLIANGEEIECKGYRCSGNADLEAPLYYLTTVTDKYSLSQCKDKIVLLNTGVGYWQYHDLVENGAVGFITFDGNVNYADSDVDNRELRTYISKDKKIIPGVNINVKSAVKLIESGVETVRIVLDQTQYDGTSQNVVLDIPGEIDETVVFTAHYDSTPLSIGTYDNMSGSVALLALAEYYKDRPHRYGVRFVWCGSEERGLLGSKAYTAAHESELDKVVLNINIDMIGCIMGGMIAVCSAEDALTSYIRYLAMEKGVYIDAKQDVYSSDSTPFADKGVPAVSFARMAPKSCATVHNRYDNLAVMSGNQMVKDIDFITMFADRMINAVKCPVKREIPANIKDSLDLYLARKRKESK